LAHKRTPLSNGSIDSVLRHWEVGRTKDLSAPPYMELNTAFHSEMQMTATSTLTSL